MIGHIANRRLSIRLVHVLFIALVAGGAFVAGMYARPWQSSAAPASNIEACVNRYTGAVRMNPYGMTTCNANESTVSWSAVDTDTHGVGETTTTETLVTIDSQSMGEGETLCPEGYVATGGGFVNISGADLVIHDSRSKYDGTGWFVKAFNPTPVSQQMAAHVVCARP